MEKAKVFHNGERVWSAGHIGTNTFFGPYQGNIDIMVSRILNIQDPAKQLQEKDKTEDLHIETDEQLWLQIVPGALCKWDPTMEMIRGPDNEIYLRTTRDIMPREELRAWFSPSLERELGISKNDIGVMNNGIGQHCPTCDMINQRSLYTTATLLCCQNDEEKRKKHERKYGELSGSSSLSSTQSSSNLDSYMVSPSYEMDSNLHHNLHSAFRRLATNPFQPFEDPKLASLISSFSEPRHLKGSSSETLADHHKNEFRKKFQGNEHYLRKHLYREGPEEKTFTLRKEHFLSSTTTRKPFKYEKLGETFRGDSDLLKNEERHRDDLYSRELDLMMSDARNVSRMERDGHVWNPYRLISGDFIHTSTANRMHAELNFTHSLESIQERETRQTAKKDNLNESNEQSRDVDPSRDTCHDSACTCSKCNARKQRKTEAESKQHSEIDEQTEEERNKSNDQISEKRNSEIKKSLDSPQGDQNSKMEQKCPLTENVKHHSFMARYCLTAPRPWGFPDPSFLSNGARRELAQYHERTTLSIASLSRYQNINPFTLPYSFPNSPQSSARASQGFTCDFCGKVYCRKYVLKIHMRTHTGFKPLKCKFCDKSFSDPSNMKKHVKLHDTENTVHKCKYCGRNFVRYRGLLNHIKSKHTEPLNIGMII